MQRELSEVLGMIDVLTQYYDDPTFELMRNKINSLDLTLTGENAMNMHIKNQIAHVRKHIDLADMAMQATNQEVLPVGKQLSNLDRAQSAMRNAIAEIETMKTELKEDENIPLPNDPDNGGN